MPRISFVFAEILPSAAVCAPGRKEW
uniref:Uncharacterized protein n=1 Tax=Arundo donax TaxID=35708 RepID=A0A0A9B3N3_ARUDO